MERKYLVIALVVFIVAAAGCIGEPKGGKTTTSSSSIHISLTPSGKHSTMSSATTSTGVQTTSSSIVLVPGKEYTFTSFVKIERVVWTMNQVVTATMSGSVTTVTVATSGSTYFESMSVDGKNEIATLVFSGNDWGSIESVIHGTVTTVLMGNASKTTTGRFTWSLDLFLVNGNVTTSGKETLISAAYTSGSIVMPTTWTIVGNTVYVHGDNGFATSDVTIVVGG